MPNIKDKISKAVQFVFKLDKRKTKLDTTLIGEFITKRGLWRITAPIESISIGHTYEVVRLSEEQLDEVGQYSTFDNWADQMHILVLHDERHTKRSRLFARSLRQLEPPKAKLKGKMKAVPGNNKAPAERLSHFPTLVEHGYFQELWYTDEHPERIRRWLAGNDGRGMRAYIIIKPIGPSLENLISWSPHAERIQQPEFALRVCLGVLRALHKLHKAGLVYRCLSPTNISLRCNSAGLLHPHIEHAVVLTNLSYTKRFDEDYLHQTKLSPFVGTLLYSSIRAQQHLASGPLDDIISLLYIMIEMYRGQLPWVELKEMDKVVSGKKDFMSALEGMADEMPRGSHKALPCRTLSHVPYDIVTPFVQYHANGEDGDALAHLDGEHLEKTVTEHIKYINQFKRRDPSSLENLCEQFYCVDYRSWLPLEGAAARS